jgi:hypothetical protein
LAKLYKRFAKKDRTLEANVTEKRSEAWDEGKMPNETLTTSEADKKEIVIW